MDVPPERTPIKGTKAAGSHAHTSAQVEHDQAVGQGAHLKDDFPRVIFDEIAALHAFPYDLCHQVRAGGAAGFEVPRVAASAFARLEEHKLEESWVLKCVVEVNFHHSCEPLLNVAGEALARQTSSQLLETLVRQSVQETRAVRVVAIDRHGSDAHVSGYPAHCHGVRSLFV